MRHFRFIASFILIVCTSRSVLASPGDLLFTLVAPDPQPGAAFGKVLSIVDGDILVGEPARLDLQIDAPGRAYIYDGKSGQLKLTFDNPQPTDQDKFGGANGDILLLKLVGPARFAELLRSVPTMRRLTKVYLPVILRLSINSSPSMAVADSHSCSRAER